MIKNEVDVLGFTLDAALEWADSIHLCDNGSTDGTYELIQEYGARYPGVVSYHQTLEPFSESLRVVSVRRLWDRAERGDWWCLLDSDEVYVDNPRDFLPRVGRKYGRVGSASIQFYLTEHDVERFERGETDWRPEDATHYLMNWTEDRFVRHQPSVPWTGRWPANMNDLYSSPERIRLLHYQYRTPEQINQRVRSRLKVPDYFKHEVADVWLPRGLTEDDLLRSEPPQSADDLWRTRVVKADALNRFDPDRPPVVDEQTLPGLPRPNRGMNRVRNGVNRVRNGIGRRLKRLVRT